MEQRQLEFLQSRKNDLLSMYKLRERHAVHDLYELLQTNGSVVVPAYDTYDDLILLINEWVFFGETNTFIKWRPSSCHENSASYCKKNKNASLYTWYALSDDNLWRQHSWVVEWNNVLETTVWRISYYGVELTWDKLEQFIKDN